MMNCRGRRLGSLLLRPLAPTKASEQSLTGHPRNMTPRVCNLFGHRGAERAHVTVFLAEDTGHFAGREVIAVLLAWQYIHSFMGFSCSYRHIIVTLHAGNTSSRSSMKFYW